MNESARYRFGKFCLIPARRELWCAQELVPTQPKVLDVLVYLVQHRDRAVGKDELAAAVWGRADVSDEVLGQIVGRARRAVGDSGEAQHSIGTVPRFGFRWVRETDVWAVEDQRLNEKVNAPVPANVGALPTWTPSHVPLSHWRAPVAALALVGVAGLGAMLLLSRNPADPGVSDDAPETSNASDSPPVAQLRAALASDRLEAARAIVIALPDQDRLRPEIRLEEATLALKEGRADGALTAFTALLADIEGRAAPLLVGQAAHGAAQAAFRLGDVASAQHHYAHAIDVLGKNADADAGVRDTLGRAWTGLGGLFVSVHTFDQAENAFARARIALEGTQNLAALARLENNVGLMLVEQYHHADALPRFEAAAELLARTGDASGEMAVLVNLVNARLALLQAEPALASEPRLRALRDRIGDPVRAARVDLARARVLLANGRLRDAGIVLQVLAARPVPDDASMAAVLDLVSSELAFEHAAWDEGSDRIRTVLASAWNSPDNGMAAFARWRLLTARLRQGDRHGVEEIAAAADAQRAAFPDDPTIGLYAALARGQAAAVQGNDVDAEAEFERALARAEQNRTPFDLVQVVTAYTQFLVRHNKLIKAGTLANRIAHWADHDYRASLVQLGVYHATDADAWRTTLAKARRLAGERTIPRALTEAPSQPGRLEGLDLAIVREP